MNPLNQMSSNGPYAPNSSNVHVAHPQLQGLNQGRNLDVLYDNHLDDRSFVPDGLVPGLRSAPPPRRESVGVYHDQLDDPMAFNVHPRLPSQRGMEQIYPGPSPSVFS